MTDLTKRAQNGTFGTYAPDTVPSAVTDTFRLDNFTESGFQGPIEVSAAAFAVRVTLSGVVDDLTQVEVLNVLDANDLDGAPVLGHQAVGETPIMFHSLDGTRYLGIRVRGAAAGLTVLMEMFE